MSTILSATRVSAGYGRRTVVREVDLHIDKGDRLLLAGPNGSGKSTLLKCLAGVVPVKNGMLLWRAQDIRAKATDWRVRHGLGFLMQTRNIFTSLTVGENIDLAAGLGNGRLKDRRDFVLDLFPFLRKHMSRRAGLLSGGERQCLGVAMVLMRRSEVLLVDEPTAGLAPKAANDLLDALQRAQAEDQFSLVIVEHNLKLLTNWVDRAVVMSRGQIVAEESQPNRLLDHDRLEQYYFA